MVIDIKEVKDYCYCPMLYKFSHDGEEYKDRDISLREKYDSDIHACAYSFFALVQNQDVVSLSSLKRTWGTLWIGNKAASDIILSHSPRFKQNENNKRKKGITAIMNMYNKFKDNPGFPILVNKKYNVPITDKLILTGNFEIIREINEKNGKFIELIDLKTEDRFNNMTYIDKDLEITAASYAFENLFDTKLDRILFYGLDRNKITITTRNSNDYDIMKTTVKNVALCIKNKLFYANPGNQCHECIYKKKCLNSIKAADMK